MESVFEKFSFVFVSLLALGAVAFVSTLFLLFVRSWFAESQSCAKRPSPTDESGDAEDPTAISRRSYLNTNDPCKSFTDRFRELDSNQQEVVLERLEAVCRELKNSTSKRVN